MQNIHNDKQKYGDDQLGCEPFVLQGMNMKGGEFDELQYASSKIILKRICWCTCFEMKFIKVEIAYAWVFKKEGIFKFKWTKCHYKKEIIIVYMEQGLEKENALFQQKPKGKGQANMALTT